MVQNLSDTNNWNYRTIRIETKKLANEFNGENSRIGISSFDIDHRHGDNLESGIRSSKYKALSVNERKNRLMNRYSNHYQKRLRRYSNGISPK